MEQPLVHNISLSKQCFTKLVLSIAAKLKFKLFSTDMTQAYLQSAKKLNRKVYVQPCLPFPLPSNMIPEPQQPLYGCLPKSGHYWDRTMKSHITRDLGLKASVLDEALYFKPKSGKLIGIFATYEDDSLYVGTEEYCELCEETK